MSENEEGVRSWIYGGRWLRSGIIIVLFLFFVAKITKNVWVVFDAMMGVFDRIALPNVIKFKNEPIIE